MSRYDSSPYQINLPLETINLINQPTLYNHVVTESETEYSNVPSTFFNNLDKKNQLGAAKSKKEKKKVKEIDMYKKEALEKIAKKHDVSLKTKDGKIKTKEQLFKSLKRKDLLKKKMKGGEDEIVYENKHEHEENELTTNQLITDKYIITISNKNFIISKIKHKIPLEKIYDLNSNNNSLNLKRLNDELQKLNNKEMYDNIKEYL